jgi:hypothetical protein
MRSEGVADRACTMCAGDQDNPHDGKTIIVAGSIAMPSTSSIRKDFAEGFKSLGLSNTGSRIILGADDAMHKILEQRFSSYEYCGQGLSIRLHPQATFEVNLSTLNHHVMFAMVDLKRSPELLSLASRMLDATCTPENLAPVVMFERRFDALMSQKLGKPVIVDQDAVLLAQVGEHCGIRATHLLTRSTFRTLHVHIPRKEAEGTRDIYKQRCETIDRLIPPGPDLADGLGSHILAWNGSNWGKAEFVAEGNILYDGVGNCGQVKKTIARYGSVKNFTTAPVDSLIEMSLGHQHLRFIDGQSSLSIPGALRIRSVLDLYLDFSCSGPGPYFLPEAGSVTWDPTGEAGNRAPPAAGPPLDPDAAAMACTKTTNNLTSCYDCCAKQGAAAGGSIGALIALAGTGAPAAGCVALAAATAGTGLVACAVAGLIVVVALMWIYAAVCDDACKHAAEDGHA